MSFRFEANIGASMYGDKLECVYSSARIDDKLAELTGDDRETAKRITLRIEQILKEELKLDD